MRRLIAGVCCFTIAASFWLAAMALVLGHPGYRAQVGLALLFAGQSLFTLAVLFGALTAAWTRIVVVLGAVALTAVAGRVLAANLSAAPAHFEGYALVIGTTLAVQGLLTLWTLCVRWRSSGDRTAPIW